MNAAEWDTFGSLFQTKYSEFREIACIFNDDPVTICPTNSSPFGRKFRARAGRRRRKWPTKSDPKGAQGGKKRPAHSATRCSTCRAGDPIGRQAKPTAAP